MKLDFIKNSSSESFHLALEQFRNDPLFCVPDDARNIIEKNGSNTKFILLGTKDFAAAFISAISGKGDVLYVVDDFKCHRGESFCGVEIISTDKFLEISKNNLSLIAINCCRFDYSKRFFDEVCRLNKIPHLNHEQATRALTLNETLDYRLADWGDTISKRADEFSILENRLGDDYSKETLLRVLTFHLTAEPEWYLNIAKPYSTLYFRSGLLNFTDNEKFVDCGASIGESTTGLLASTKGKIAHSWMIEPDKFNIKTLEKIINKYKNTEIYQALSLHKFAVGENSETVPFIHMGGHGGIIATSPNENYENVEVMPIDKIIDDLPTFIKMDIEGYELPALKGAAKSIREAKPKLAVSAYHRATDLLEIPKFINSIAPDYKIGLRHHTDDRWDTCLYFYN